MRTRRAWLLSTLALGVFCPGLVTAAPAAPCWGRTLGTGTPCGAGGNLKLAQRVKAPPAAVAARYPGAAVYGIDLDSDGKPDFIVEGAKVNGGKPGVCFVDATGKTRSCEPHFPEGFQYYWFMQLDSDPMLELFAMTGDEDSSDFEVQKLDPTTWKRRRVVRIHALVSLDPKAPDQAAWGYPWDVTDVIATFQKEKTLLLAAPPSAWEGTEVDEPLVTVLFRGKPSQEWEPGAYGKVAGAARYMSLEELAGLGTGKAR